MSGAARWMGPGLAGLAGLALAVQLALLLRTEPGLERMPLFEPASYGAAHALGAPGCERELGGLAPDARALITQIPFDRFLDGLDGLGRAREHTLSDAVVTQQREIEALHSTILELRNRRHADNVRAMELTVELASVLDDAQLAWVLDNRDAVATSRLDEATWAVLTGASTAR